MDRGQVQLALVSSAFSVFGSTSCPSISCTVVLIVNPMVGACDYEHTCPVRVHGTDLSTDSSHVDPPLETAQLCHRLGA